MFILVRDWDFFKDIPYDIWDSITRTDFERSLEQDNIKIKNDPENPWSYIYRGSTYKKHKMYNESLKDYLKAYDLKNSFFMVLPDISNLYLALGDTDKAYDYILLMMEKAPSPDRSFFDLAIIYDYEWKSKEAIDSYTKYITKSNIEKEKSKYIFSLKRRAVHYVLLKEYDKAKEDIEILFKANPEDNDVEELKGLLVDTKKTNALMIREKFKLDVHQAIVGIKNI